MTVFLLKNRSEDLEQGHQDPYEQCIPDIRFVPIMDYHCVNLHELAQTLNHLDALDAIVVTSQRAVDALKEVLPDSSSGIFGKPVYTVGPTTAQRLIRLGFLNVNGAESGSGGSLASSMAEVLPPNSNLMFLAGEIHRPLLPAKLTEAGHIVTTKIVYRTTPNLDVSNYLQNSIQDGDWIVFFSPSHTTQVLEFLRQSPLRINIAAIGPTTRDFLTENGFTVNAVAPKPAAEGLKAAIYDTHACKC